MCHAQAPLFGMLSWVNSMEVKRWLQAQVTDAMPDTLPPAAVPLPATALLDPSAFAPGMARHNSDSQLQQAQHDLVRSHPPHDAQTAERKTSWQVGW